MRYYPIKIHDYMNDKLIHDSTGQDLDSDGIFDKRFDFEMKEKRFQNVRFQINGGLAEYDNVVCEGQKIELPKGEYTFLEVLGCTEYSTYSEQICFQMEDESVQKAGITLYAISENIDTLYECELDSRTRIAFHAKGKYAQKMKYYISRIEVPKGSKLFILPDNPEMHIAACTLIQA